MTDCIESFNFCPELERCGQETHHLSPTQEKKLLPLTDVPLLYKQQEIDVVLTYIIFKKQQQHCKHVAKGFNGVLTHPTLC